LKECIPLHIGNRLRLPGVGEVLLEVIRKGVADQCAGSKVGWIEDRNEGSNPIDGAERFGCIH